MKEGPETISLFFLSKCLSKESIHETTRTKDTNRHEILLVLLRVMRTSCDSRGSCFDLGLVPLAALCTPSLCGEWFSAPYHHGEAENRGCTEEISN